MPYTLLHISDLHRAKDDPIGNHELLSTLLADRDRFIGERPAISSPDAIVVSGDLIQGAPLGTAEYSKVIDTQYKAASEFLIGLADEFLDGDRSRLVIVPGNHDVDWNMALAAMSPLGEDEVPADFSPLLCGPSDDLRWSWRERRVYRINNRELYKRRLEQFNSTVDSFYAATKIVKNEHYRLHSLLDGRIAVIAFNSCVGNDCFALHGAIDEDALAQAHIALTKHGGHELLIAVWHHNTDGDPYSTDYMAVSSVQRLIGRGFRLGLHGHQHRAAASLRYVHLPEEERMAVVSAGSLCAGHYGLPAGVNRQYNLLEIADSLALVRVHVREMAISTNFAPARRPEFGFKSYVDLEWTLPAPSARATIEREQRLVLDAERALGERRNEEAWDILKTVDRPPGSYSRRLLVRSLSDEQRWQELVDEVGEPTSIEELVAVVMARAELGDPDDALTFMDVHAERLQLPAPTVRELRGVLQARKSMR
jgi:3',5'-cyclic AMP phosphodiesterase CpdA